MYKSIWMSFFISLYCLAVAQERQGTAVYLMDEKAVLQNLLNIYQDVDKEKTLSKTYLRETTLYFDEKS